MEEIIITTTENIPDRQVSQILGVARGSTVRARHIGRDIVAVIRSILGGEVDEYTKLQADSREQALQRMTDDAKSMGADAIVNVRITTTMVSAGAAEILTYGTAVKLR